MFMYYYFHVYVFLLLCMFCSVCSVFVVLFYVWVCVWMCIVLLPPGVNPIAINKYIVSLIMLTKFGPFDWMHLEYFFINLPFLIWINANKCRTILKSRVTWDIIRCNRIISFPLLWLFYFGRSETYCSLFQPCF